MGVAKGKVARHIKSYCGMWIILRNTELEDLEVENPVPSTIASPPLLVTGSFHGEKNIFFAGVKTPISFIF